MHLPRSIISSSPSLLLLTLSLFSLIPSILSSTTSISITSESPDLISLSAFNFSTQVLSKDSNAWLIEFYSPSCRHCKAFAPTWYELAKNKKYQRDHYPNGGKFSLARVDCQINADMCIEQGVEHFPRLTIYRDGVQQPGEYAGKTRDYISVSNYIDSQAEEYRNSKGISNVPDPKYKDSDQSSSTASTTATAETQKVPGPDLPIPSIGEPISETTAQVKFDSQDKDLKEALEAAEKIKAGNNQSPPPINQVKLDSKKNYQLPNPDGKVIAFGKDEKVLDLEKFKKFLEKDNKDANGGAVFVKFFAPWCPHCKSMAKSYVQVAQSLKNQINVVEVDCEANKPVCMEFKIQSFPTLRMYNSGIATEFRGARDHDSMFEWASKAGADSVIKDLKDAKELDNANGAEEVVFLYLQRVGASQDESKAVEEASKSLLSTPFHIYKTSSPEFFQRYSSSTSKSSILAFKDHSLSSPIASFDFSSQSSSSLKSNLEDWISKNRFPLIAEIKSTNFNDIMFNSVGSKVALVALSEVNHGGQVTSTGIGKKIKEIELENFRNLARRWRDLKGEDNTEIGGERVIWAWIEADRWESALKKYYSLTPSSFPSILLTDGKKLEYFPLPYSSSYVSNLTQAFISSEKSYSTISPPSGTWLNSTEIFLEMKSIFKGERVGRTSRSLLDQGLKGASVNVDRIVVATLSHPILSFVFLAALIFVFVTYLRRHGGQSGWDRETGPPPLGGNTKFD